jgi:DNA-binding beta-propeller fold protein YncE
MAFAVSSVMLAPALAMACGYTGGAAQVLVPGSPFATAPSADGCWIFVSLYGGAGPKDPGSIAVLHNEGGAFRLRRVVPLRSSPLGITLTHDGGALVAAAGDVVAVLDVQQLETAAGDPVLGYIPEGSRSGAFDVATSLDDRFLFTTDERAARVTVADLAAARRRPFNSNVIVGYVPQGGAPTGMALSPDGQRLYVTDEIAPSVGPGAARCTDEGGSGARFPEGALAVIDVDRATRGSADAVAAMAPAGCNPVRVVLSPDGKIAWVTARGDNALLSFDTSRLLGVRGSALISKMTVGASPVGVAVRPDGSQVWVANSNRFAKLAAASLSLIDPKRNIVVSTLTTGAFPRDVRFLADGKTLVVAVFGARTVRFEPTESRSPKLR